MVPETQKTSRTTSRVKQGSENPAPAIKLPTRGYFKLNEVCELAEIQPYVLRFWESEFPQIAGKKRGRQTTYGLEALRKILQIKCMLQDEEYSIADARSRLESGEDPAEPEPVEEKRDPAGLPFEEPAQEAVSEMETNERIESLQSRLADLRTRYEGATRQISLLKGRLQSVDRSREHGKDGDVELAALRRAHEDALAEIESLKARNVALAAESEKFRGALHEAEQARDRFREARHQVADRLEAILRAFRGLTMTAGK